MKAVLLSIRPNWCKLIWSGMKTIEVRKNRPTIKTPFKVYIYCTNHYSWFMKFSKTGRQKMNGRIIGEFTCEKIERVDIPYPAYQDRLDERFTKDSCVPYFQLHRYASRNRLSDNLFFWHISEVKFYDKPVKLKDFWGIQPCKHHGDCCTCRRWDGEAMTCKGETVGIERPPQSWFYVEVADETDSLR